MWLMNRKGQTTAEYAVVVGVVIAAIVAMQVYVRRGLQAKVKDVTDNFTNAGAGVSTTKQYEPYYASSDYTVQQERSSKDAIEEGGKVSRTNVKENTFRSGSSKTEAPQ